MYYNKVNLVIKFYGVKMKHKRKLNKNNLILVLVLFFFIMLFIYSSYKILIWLKNNKDNQIIEKEIKEYVTIIKEDDVKGDVENNTNNTNNKNNEINIEVDFNKLKEKNPDVVAYIKINNTNIDYPIVQGTDNSYYLTHNFEKKYNESGWIFLDFNNKLDNLDRNIIIYGHNRRNDSMFGTLKKVFNTEWQNNKDNRIIYFVTPNGLEKYEIFSIYEETASTYPLKTNFENEGEYYNFIENLKSKSFKNFELELSKNSRIITLSTCGNNNNNRILVHAIKINN